MGFAETLKKYMDLYNEAGENQSALPPQDAAAPAPAGEQPEPVAADKGPQAISPEGYVDMVRMLAKALVMTIPVGSIDDLFNTPITNENAVEVREGLQVAINSNVNYEDNPQKLENPKVQKFINSVNENNFMAKYKEILNIMKRYSNDIAV